jgi:hypothetical protein
VPIRISDIAWFWKRYRLVPARCPVGGGGSGSKKIPYASMAWYSSGRDWEVCRCISIINWTREISTAMLGRLLQLVTSKVLRKRTNNLLNDTVLSLLPSRVWSSRKWKSRTWHLQESLELGIIMSIKPLILCYEPIPFPSKAAAATKASNAELWVEAFAGYWKGPVHQNLGFSRLLSGLEGINGSVSRTLETTR